MRPSFLLRRSGTIRARFPGNWTLAATSHSKQTRPRGLQRGVVRRVSDNRRQLVELTGNDYPVFYVYDGFSRDLSSTGGGSLCHDDFVRCDEDVSYAFPFPVVM